jgi:DNA modification methylase
MQSSSARISPGRVRDAILQILSLSASAVPVRQIESKVSEILGPTPASSIRSYLRLNTPNLFVREGKGLYRKRLVMDESPVHETTGQTVVSSFEFRNTKLFHADCFNWLKQQPDCSIHAVVTDPPYGLHEYTPEQQEKLRARKGGVWRVPPSFDGCVRAPLPRFTTLTADQLAELRRFFLVWARLLLPKLVPGANVIAASNPLLSYIVSGALAEAGLERRGEIIRLVMTMRGGDRPKAAHEEFPEISVMPRSMWEPWILFRKPVEGRVQDNLRRWKAGGFRRPSLDRPFGDVVASGPTHKSERAIAPHPSLKPQSFLRQLIRAALPLGEGVILDPFAGAGSTLAACAAVGYQSVGVEKDLEYFKIAREAIPGLAALKR